MKKYFCVLLWLAAGAALFAEYVLLPFPKESELGDARKYYDAGVAADALPASETAALLGSAAGAEPGQLPALLADKREAGKAAKFLKLAKIGKNSRALGIKFGKYKVVLFSIPANSRMRRGMNFLAFETAADGSAKWRVSLNDMFLSLIAQCDFASPKPIDISSLPVFSASDKAALNALARDGMPVLAFKNGALVSLDAAAGVESDPAAKFYAKIQKVFFSWKLDEYASYMSPKSAEKFRGQYSAMTGEQRKAALSGYFAWKKKILKSMKLSDTEHLIIFKRFQPGQPDQFDVAYITLSSKDGSSGALEKFGERTPLDLMLSRYIFKNKTRPQQ